MKNITVEDILDNSNRFGKETVTLDTVGLWEILGEDPNCDFGGHHHNPSLGYVTGRFRDVVEYAMEFDNFITWGSGGKLHLIKDVKEIPYGYSSKKNVENRKRAKEIKEQISKLENELSEIDKDKSVSKIKPTQFSIGMW